MRVAVRRAEGGERDRADRLRETYPVIAANRLSAETKLPHLFRFGVNRSQGAACERRGVVDDVGLACMVDSWCLTCESHLPRIALNTGSFPLAEFNCLSAIDKSLRYE